MATRLRKQKGSSDGGQFAAKAAALDVALSKKLTLDAELNPSAGIEQARFRHQEIERALMRHMHPSGRWDDTDAWEGERERLAVQREASHEEWQKVLKGNAPHEWNYSRHSTTVQCSKCEWQMTRGKRKGDPYERLAGKAWQHTRIYHRGHATRWERLVGRVLRRSYKPRPIVG